MFHGLTEEQLERMVSAFKAHSFLNAIGYVEDLIWSLTNDPNEIGNYTLEDMSEITGLSVLTLRQYVREKKINALKKWKNWMVTGNEIARFLYQRETGKEIPTDVTVGILIQYDPNVNDYDSPNYILDFKFFNVLEMGDWKRTDYTFNKIISKYFDKADSGSITLEVMRDYPDFFERVGLLSNKNNGAITATNYYIITPEKRRKLNELADGDYEVGNKSLMEIRDIFGEPNQTATTLKMYRELMSITYKYNESSEGWKRSVKEVLELKEKLEEIKRNDN